MPQHHGIQVYEILEKGNVLNGICTRTDGNPKSHYGIDNEIAIKQTPDDRGVEGKYNCRFMQSSGDPKIIDCTVEINFVGSVYECRWYDDNKVHFTGIGLMMDNKYLAVSYIDA